MSTVTIREDMDFYQAVTEPYCDLIRSPCLVINPIPAIFKQLFCLNSYLMLFASYVLVCLSFGACPFPHLTEHFSVNQQDEFLSKYLFTAECAFQRPFNCLLNICLLKFIKLSSG